MNKQKGALNLQALHKQDYFQNLVVPQQFYNKFHNSLKYLLL